MEELSPGPSSGPHDLPGLFCGRFERMREEPANTGVQLFGPTLAVLDTQTGEPARACVLDAALLPTAEARAALVRVLGELGELNESALVPQVFVGEDGERVVVCYDPLQGAFALRDMDDGPGCADLANELQRLARQLARALATLHARGLVHGMLAGEAVFVGPRGPAAFQYGFASLCARAELERRWAALDPALLAPELRGGGAFTPATDVYAWGVALTEFATGLRGAAALQADEPAGLPAGLWALFAACLVDDPAARPQVGDELVRRLESLSLADPVAAAAPVAVVSLVDPAASGAPVAAVSDSLSLASGSDEHVLEDSDPAELSMTSLEEMVVAGERRPPTLPPTPPIRPPTLPPSALTASVAASIASAPVRPASGPHATLGEAGGRSASGLRRVHVLTEDAIVRPGRAPGGRAGDGPGEPSGALFDGPVGGADERELTEAPAHQAADSVPPPPEHAAPIKSPAPPATAPVPAAAAASAAPQRSDRSFWLAIVVLLLAVALAWAFT